MLLELPTFVSLIVISIHIVNGSPNFIVFFADDVGYGDFHSYGHPTQEKGPIDEMGDEGMRFTSWYSGDSMCTPSRASLLTGRLPIRIGVVGPNRVFWQWDEGGLPKSEITIAEALQERGYATGMVGKWHLGINEKVVNDGGHLPHHHGFQYVGINYPYGQNWKCDPKKFTAEEMSVKCFKYDNSTFIQQPTDMINSTVEMVNDAKDFITKNKDRPFFFYMPLLQAHCSLFCSPGFCGTSRRGMYGDNINEMSWAVGQVLDTVKQLNIHENTLAIFTSDNGPQLEMCFDGGSSGIFKGGKSSTWEGGIRMPAFAWWPGTIPSGSVSHEIVSSVDLYATLLELARGNSNDDGIVRDSRSIVGVLKGQEPSPHEFLFHYCSDRLMSVRSGKYKISYFTQAITMDLLEFCDEGIPDDDRLTNLGCYGDSVVVHDPPLIFNTNADPAEEFPLDVADFVDLLARVNEAVIEHKETITPVDSILGLKNEALQPCCNYPSCTCNYPNSVESLVKTEL